ncbi:Down syndrome cell adhesion molecule-like protein Dscam2 isoform X3 [Limulus polyphemus]|uniref:Down syndrome cell adhesion molecule-like protein Dscam2 isoform X3 n=1 Tax=Limulus polyphemus TaxID=6850 RepID=A0ABM1TAU0_LIMPO|nr:Down syndrome cell adhesion molecule-like protein Dscam2 isoform X3 [Limulus polyphemus]
MLFLTSLVMLISSLFLPGMVSGFLMASQQEANRGPRFLEEPPVLVEFDNSSGAVVPCTAEGNPNPLVEWVLQDGSKAHDLAGLRHFQPDGSLVFPSFRAKDFQQDVHDAIYRCIAYNTIGKIRSRDVRVKASIQQDYKVQLFDEFVIRGNTAVLRCHVPSFVRDYVTFTWERDNGIQLTSTTLQVGGKYSILSSGKLYIRNVTPEDERAIYRCHTHHRLTSKVVSSSSSGRLIVREPQSKSIPNIVDRQIQVRAREGETVELGCAAQGFPVPAYRWYKDGKLLYGEQNVRHGGDSLIFQYVSSSDSGNYVCVANNTQGEERVDMSLIVSAPFSVHVTPQYHVVDVGQSTTLNCSLTGYPVHKIKWMKNTVPLVTNPRIRILDQKILHFSAVEREDRGMYQCFVYNDKESAQGTSELKLGEVTPVILSAFTEQVLKPGVDLSLSCTATGNPIPQITWTLEELGIPELSRIRLGDYVTSRGHVVSYVNISNVRVEDGGEYTCMATNMAGVVTHSATVSIYGPPVIRPMRNLSVLSGETMTLRCPVAGYPIKSMTWIRAGSQLPVLLRQKLKPGGKLLVKNVERVPDEGEYTCIAKNPDGDSASGKVFVSVKVAPHIDEEFFPEKRTATEAESVKLLCSIVKGDPPISITWDKDGVPISRERHRRIQSLEDSSLLILKHLKYRDSGNYTCHASNSAATVSRTTAMIVNVPPRWLIEPIDKDVIRGERVAIDCIAEGYPQPRISWKRPLGSQLNDFREVYPNYRTQVFSNGTLMIQDLEDSDNGHYLCQASNGIGSGLTKLIVVTVHAPPRFETTFISQTVAKGAQTVLNCEVEADRPVFVKWQKDKHPLDIKTEKRFSMKQAVTKSKVQSSLVISSSHRYDSALYTCMVKNDYGSDETNIQLIVQEPPSPPTDVTKMSVGSRTVELSWKPSYSGNSAITKYTVEYKNISDDWNHCLQISVSGFETSATIRNLFPVSSYDLRIIAENSLGKSKPSEVLTLVTAEEVPGGPPLNVRVEANGAHSLKVTWKPPQKHLLHGKLQGYYLGYKQKDSIESFQYKTILSPGSGDVTSYLTNLRRLTTYNILVQAYNNAGAGPQSDKIQATTLESSPPTSPGLAVVSTTSSSITIEWEKSGDSELKNYIVHYKAEEKGWMKERITTKTHKYTLKSLQCGTRYRLYMTASNSLGTGEPSSTVIGRTKGGAPVSPHKRTFLLINATSVTLNTSSWEDGGCPIQYFSIRYRPTFHHVWNTVASRMMALQKFLKIGHLAPGREYSLLVSAHNEAGTTEAEYTFQTLNYTFFASAATLPPPAKPPAGWDSTLPFYRNLTVILPVIFSIIVLLVVTIVVLVCLKRQSDDSTGNSSGDGQPRKSRQVENVGMAEFPQKPPKEMEPIYKPSYYSSPTRKPTPVAARGRMRRRDETHEYAEPYASVPPPRCVVDEGSCPVMISMAQTRNDGPYATIKRSPPRPVCYLPPMSQDVKLRSAQQVISPERSGPCCQSASSPSGSSGERPSSM